MYVDRVNARSNKSETNFAYGLEQKVNSNRLLNILRSFQHCLLKRLKVLKSQLWSIYAGWFQCYIA